MANPTITPTGNQRVNLSDDTISVELDPTDPNLSGIKDSTDAMDDWDESDRAKVNIIVGQAGVAAGAGAAGATVQRVILCTDDPGVTALQVIDDWDESDRAKVNPIVGQAGIASGSGAAGATVPRVILCTDDPAVTALQIIDDWDESDRAKVNPIVGQAGIASGSGAAGATVPRVILCTDDPAVTALQIMDDWDESDRAKVNPIVGQAGIASGSGAAGATVPRVILCTDDPAVTSLAIIDDWDGVDDAAAGTDGARILARAGTVQKTAVANGDNTLIAANVYGEQVIAGYSWMTDSNRIEEVDPVNEQPVIDSLVNLQAVAADPGTSYAPSSDGLEMFGFKDLSLHIHLLGGIGAAATDRTVTVTIEASNDVEVPAGTRLWIDITKSAYNCGTASMLSGAMTSTGAVAANYMLNLDEANFKRIRISYDWDADPSVTNGKIVINARRKAL